jgi:hypothetical protein
MVPMRLFIVLIAAFVVAIVLFGRTGDAPPAGAEEVTDVPEDARPETIARLVVSREVRTGVPGRWHIEPVATCAAGDASCDGGPWWEYDVEVDAPGRTLRHTLVVTRRAGRWYTQLERDAAEGR